MSYHKAFVISLAAAVVLCVAPTETLRAQAVYSEVNVNVVDFGADPQGTVDSTPAFNKWWSACISGGTRMAVCSIPPGTYLLNENLTLDFSSNPGGGVVVQGAGQNTTLLEFANGKHMSIVDSSGGAFYGTFSDFGVLANSSGPALQLGQTNFSDALNSFAFRDIWVKNVASVTGSSGVQLNQVYSTAFSNLTTSDGCQDPNGNCPNGGSSLLIRQSSFNTFQGSFSQARNGVKLADGYNFGNVFTSPDLEVNYNDLVINNDSSSYNTFIGGQWVYVNSAIHASNGYGNVVEYANFSGSIPTAGPAIGVASGLTVKGVYNSVSTPPFPSSGQVIANTTGRDVFVNLYNMNDPTVCYGQGASTCITPGSSTAVLLRSGDSIEVEFSGRPGSWVWMETN